MQKIFLGCLMLLLSFTAYAGNKAGDFTLSFASGYDYFSGKRNIKNTGIPYAMVGYNFTQRVGIEALWGTFITTFRDSIPDRRQIRGSLFSIDGVYRFFPHTSVEPFLLAGVGVLGLNPSQTDSNYQTNINIGAGLQLFSNEIVAFRVEARDFYTMMGGKNDVFLGAGVTFLLRGC